MTKEKAKDILGLKTLLELDKDGLKKVYRKLAKERHPDALMTVATVYTFNETKQAYEELDRYWDSYYAQELSDSLSGAPEELSDANLKNMVDSVFNERPWDKHSSWVERELKDYMSDAQFEAFRNQGMQGGLYHTSVETDRECMEAVLKRRGAEEYAERLRKASMIVFKPNELKEWDTSKHPFGHNFANDQLSIDVIVTIKRNDMIVYTSSITDAKVSVLSVTNVNVSGLLSIGDEVTIEVKDIITVTLPMNLAVVSATAKPKLGIIQKPLGFNLKINRKLERIEVTL